MSTSTQSPIPESEWVEFASREWCEEANRYLQEQAPLHPDALDGVEWSVTERWQDAPPHLGFQNNVAGFWFAISGGKIEVGAGPAAQADTEIDGDYNAILPIGWTIYNGDAEIQARAQREYGHLSRDKPVKIKGQFPSHPPLLPFLGGLHDHMARRTVNNPDVDHRIEHYGLRAHVDELANQGHTILNAAFTERMADELRTAGGCGHRWEEMVVHPWVLTLVDKLLGNGAVVVAPAQGGASERTLTAVWTLADDSAASTVVGDTTVSIDRTIGTEADEAPQVSYVTSSSELAARRVVIGEESIERNPPVFWARCGRNA